MSFYRKPSPLEMTYLSSDTATYSPLVNQFFTEGHGELNLDHWKEAVELASLSNPGVRLQMKGVWGWRYWDDKGPLPLVKKIESDWDGMCSEGAPYIGNPIDIKRSPLSEVILIDGPIQRVLFRTHHAITDGKGTLHWMAEIYRALRGEKLQGSEGKAYDWEIAQKTEYPERTIIEGGCIPITPNSKNPELRDCRWVRMFWKGNYSKIVPKIILAVCRIAWREHGDGKILFRIPSDLRRYLEKNAPFTMANAIGAIDLEITPSSTLNSIQADIIKAMRNKSDLSVFTDKAKLAYWLPGSMFKYSAQSLTKVHSEGKYRMTGTISSLGNLDPKDFSYSKFTSRRTYGVPIPYENRPIFIGFSINPDGLLASISMPKALANTEELKDLANQIKKELDSM